MPSFAELHPPATGLPKGLAQPAFVLAAQFRRPHIWRGEHMLWAAALYHAQIEAQYPDHHERHHVRVGRLARDWIQSDAHYVGSFRFVCDVLGLDYQRTRGAMLRHARARRPNRTPSYTWRAGQGVNFFDELRAMFHPNDLGVAPGTIDGGSQCIICGWILVRTDVDRCIEGDGATACIRRQRHRKIITR